MIKNGNLIKSFWWRNSEKRLHITYHMQTYILGDATMETTKRISRMFWVTKCCFVIVMRKYIIFHIYLIYFVSFFSFQFSLSLEIPLESLIRFFIICCGLVLSMSWYGHVNNDILVRVQEFVRWQIITNAMATFSRKVFVVVLNEANIGFW